jgi:hypothetical protein
LTELVELGTITHEQADGFNEFYDLLVDAGLMEYPVFKSRISV